MDKENNKKDNFKTKYLSIFNNLDITELQTKDTGTVIIKPFSPILLCYAFGINTSISITEEIPNDNSLFYVPKSSLEDQINYNSFNNKKYIEKNIELDHDWILLENDIRLKRNHMEDKNVSK